MTTLNSLGQTKVPSVFANIQAKGLCDLMNIVALALTKDTGGRYKKTASSNAYSNVPVTIEPIQRLAEKKISADQTVSVVRYKLTFPTHQNGVRINIDPKAHRLNVIARGNEPAKVFRVIGVKEQSGVVFEAECEKEN